MSAVVFGSRIQMMAAAKRYGMANTEKFDILTDENQLNTNLWVILGIAGMQRNRLQVESAVQIDSSNDVL